MDGRRVSGVELGLDRPQTEQESVYIPGYSPQSRQERRDQAKESKGQAWIQQARPRKLQRGRFERRVLEGQAGCETHAARGWPG